MPAQPPDRDTIDARMARHVWAVDRLWAGIVGDDDVAWNAGIELLAAGKPIWSQLTREQQAAGRLLHDMAEGQRRANTTRVTTRANIYGELLVVCASCHVTP